MHLDPIRVLIDARWHGRGDGSGIAGYGDTLAAAIHLAGGQAERLVDGGAGAARGAWRRAVAGLHPRQAQVETGLWRADDVFRSAREGFVLTGRLLPLAIADGPGLAHWTHPLALRLRNAINIWTIHDAIPLGPPGLTAMRRGRHQRLLRAIAARADHLVTVSDHARGELIAALGLDPARITTVMPAGALTTDPPTPDPAHPPGSYWIALGRRDRRKNLPRLVAAWAASGSARPLLIVGPDGDETADLAAPGVIVTGWLPPERVAALLAHASGLLMPSLAEGFGLPIVEAMALGVPVLTSAGGATQEVAGGAALLVDARDVRAIAAGIAALENPATAAEFVARGRVRAAEFTLSAYAERLASLYRTLSGGRPAV